MPIMTDTIQELLSNPDLAKLVATSVKQALMDNKPDDIPFGRLFDLYVNENVKPLGKQENDFRYFFNKHGKHWKDVACNLISTFDLLQWRNDTAANSGNQGAQRALDRMSAVFNWGIKHQVLMMERNPCKGIPRFPCRPRERFLSMEELEHLDRALSEESRFFQDFFIICVLTGARRGNVCSMKWSDLDLDLGLWAIPAAKFKTREAQTIPLTPPVVALLRDRKERIISQWVFPSPKTDGHLTDPRKAWARICARAGFTDTRIHDLRRTLGSHLALAGESAYIIGKILGHRDHRSTAVYARLTLQPARVAMTEVHHSWKECLSLPATTSVTTNLPQSDPTKAADSRPQTAGEIGMLTDAEMVIVQARIVSALGNGATTRKELYKKFPGRFKLDKCELSRALEDLLSRGIIETFHDERKTYCVRYRLTSSGWMPPNIAPELASSIAVRHPKREKVIATPDIVAQKILESIDQGGNRRKDFWRSLPRKSRISPAAMNRILKDLRRRKIIEAYAVRPGSSCLIFKRAE